MSEHLISRDDAENDLLSFATYKAESIASSDGQASAMAAVLPLYLAANKVDLAAELANAVEDPFTRDRLLIATAARCAELDDDEYALQLVESIEDPGMVSEGLERVATVKAGKGQFEAALKVAESLDHPDPVYAAIAVKEFAVSRDAFFRSLEDVRDRSIRVQACLLAASEELGSESADKEKAVVLLMSAVDEIGPLEHEEERIRSFLEAGNLLIDADRRGNAIEVIDKAFGAADELDNVHRDAFLAAASVAFLRAGSQELSDRALDQVLDKTQLSGALLGHARIYNERGETADALESLDESNEILRSQKENETRSSPERFKLFGSIAAQAAVFGVGEKAIEIADGIEDDDERIAALTQVAAILVSGAKLDEARQTVNLIRDPPAHAFAKIAMSDSASNAGDAETAKAFLEDALSSADSVPQPVSRSSALIALGSRFFAIREMERAREAADLSFASIFTLRDESSLASLTCELSRVFTAADFSLTDGQKKSMKRSIGAA